jgi:hypothetical protein
MSKSTIVRVGAATLGAMLAALGTLNSGVAHRQLNT